MGIDIHHRVHFVGGTSRCDAAPTNRLEGLIFLPLNGILVPYYPAGVGTLELIDYIEVIYSGSDAYTSETFEMSGGYPSGSTPTIERVTIQTNKEPGKPIAPFTKADATWAVTPASFTIEILTSDSGDGGNTDVWFNYTGDAPPAAVKVKIRRQTANFTC